MSGCGIGRALTGRQIDLAGTRLASSPVHRGDTRLAAQPLEIPGLDELGEDAADLPVADINNITYVPDRELLTEAAVGPSDLRRGAVPGVEHLRLTDHGQIVSQRARPGDDGGSTISASEPEHGLHHLVLGHML